MTCPNDTYSLFMPGKTIYGAGSADSVPEAITLLGGQKPLIVTDKGIVKVGILKRITERLSGAGISYAVYDETVPNPRVQNVIDGVETFKKNACDSLITLGGGSSHDCGKGIGLVVQNGGHIQDFEGIDRSDKPFLPYVAVNTTSGTASEMTRFTIISDPQRQVKMAIVDWRVTPGIAINDPLLTMSMPPDLTAATGMDALTHAVEAFVSVAATPLTDSAAEKAFALVFEHLRGAVANGQNLEAREAMCHAEYLAGVAFNNASLGYVHAMAHQLGGFYDLPHGECNAVLLPYVSRFNLISCVKKFARMAACFGENTDGLTPRDAADLALKAITRLSADVGIPSNLIELGRRYRKDVKPSDIPTMTRNAQKDVCGLTNPRRATDEEIAAIFSAAMEG